jgi:hypothetical protein
MILNGLKPSPSTPIQSISTRRKNHCYLFVDPSLATCLDPHFDAKTLITNEYELPMDTTLMHAYARIGTVNRHFLCVSLLQVMASCGMHLIALFGVLAYGSDQRRIETRMPTRRAIAWNENGPIRLCANVSTRTNWPTCPDRCTEPKRFVHRPC